MRTILLLWFLMSLSILIEEVYAGGVAKRRKMQQQQIQQRMAQQRMIQMQQIQKQQIQQQQAVAQQRIVQKEVTEKAMMAKVEKEMISRHTPVAEVVDLNQMVTALDQSSHPWTLMIDDEAKEAIVVYYINRYRQEGVKINKCPFFYVKLIDTMAQETPEMLNQPLATVMKVLAIVEYDFDNGQNKDFLVRQVLGEKGYWENKKRMQKSY